MIKIGFVGYSGTPFDKEEALEIITKIFAEISVDYPSEDIEIVSGATALGIPNLVYVTAEVLNLSTIGIMCKRGYDQDNTLYPCDVIYAVGENWGDESDTFIDYIDVLYRIGGGKQSLEEVKMAKSKGIPVFEFDLPQIEKEIKN